MERGICLSQSSGLEGGRPKGCYKFQLMSESEEQTVVVSVRFTPSKRLSFSWVVLAVELLWRSTISEELQAKLQLCQQPAEKL